MVRVEEGSDLVTQSGNSLEQIVTAVKRVSDIVAEIAAAGNEQSVGIEQVNKAVMQLDELTQQNAALVEEASAASQSMATQATSLSSTMQRFHLGEDIPLSPAPLTRQTLKERAGKKLDARRSAAPPAQRPPVEKPVIAATGTDGEVWEEF